jgi:single-strand DNA-binding protein
MLNKVMVIGNLGKDPETKNVNGQTLCKFSVATTEYWKDKAGAKQERTEWFRVTTWGKLAENCGKYLAKGRRVYVEGKLQTSTYEKDGQTHYATDLIANEVKFLSPAEQSSSGPEQYDRGGGDRQQEAPDLPF